MYRLFQSQISQLENEDEFEDDFLRFGARQSAGNENKVPVLSRITEDGDENEAVARLNTDNYFRKF
jgi:hypothetical protein